MRTDTEIGACISIYAFKQKLNVMLFCCGWCNWFVQHISQQKVGQLHVAFTAAGSKTIYDTKQKHQELQTSERTIVHRTADSHHFCKRKASRRAKSEYNHLDAGRFLKKLWLSKIKSETYFIYSTSLKLVMGLSVESLLLCLIAERARYS